MIGGKKDVQIEKLTLRFEAHKIPLSTLYKRMSKLSKIFDILNLLSVKLEKNNLKWLG